MCVGFFSIFFLCSVNRHSMCMLLFFFLVCFCRFKLHEHNREPITDLQLRNIYKTDDQRKLGNLLKF